MLGVAEEILQLIHVAQLFHQLQRAGEIQRVKAREVVVGIPVLVGEKLLEVLRQLADLPVEIHVLQELLGELLNLGALFGRH